MKTKPISLSGLLAVGALLAVGVHTHAQQEEPAAVDSAAVDSVAGTSIANQEDLEEVAATNTNSADTGAADEVLQKLMHQLPGIQFSEVSPSIIPGLFEVIADGQIYYVSESAQYLIDGSLIRLADRTNLTDARLGSIHMGLIEELDEADMLIYEPETPSTRSITVFTDISCGYCRRLHAELDSLLEEGVRVRYLLFPRAGVDSQAHKDLESVWCADNPQEAMTIAKAGGEIDPRTCDTPILKHMELAERVGLRGTPLIYIDSGEKVPGYREAAILAAMVHDSEPMAEAN